MSKVDGAPSMMFGYVRHNNKFYAVKLFHSVLAVDAPRTSLVLTWAASMGALIADAAARLGDLCWSSPCSGRLAPRVGRVRADDGNSQAKGSGVAVKHES
jgi:hypothetical protein